jgi:plastocyanin
MKKYHLDRHRMALFSAVLVIGGSAALLIGSSAVGSYPSRAPATAHSMAGMRLRRGWAGAQLRPSGRAQRAMPTAQPTSAAVTAAAAVRLHQQVVNVSIMNFAFGPARLVVSPGTRIIWTNQDSDPHTVTSTMGIWASEALDTGNRFARVFTTAGMFPYYCTIHPFMHGTIVVQS